MKITVTLDNGTILTGEVSEAPASSKDFGPLAPAAPGASMDVPRVGYAFGIGTTSFQMPVEAGVVYSLEAVPSGAGYGGGSISVHRGDGSEVQQPIVGGFCGAFPVQATATESVAVTVNCTAPGLIRFFM